MAATSTKQPPDEPWPSVIPIRVEQNETRSYTATLFTRSELNGKQRLTLTGKTIRMRATIDGTVYRWDNGANGGLTLADQTTNQGECDIAFTSSKGTQKAGDWPYELWDATTGTEHKHAEGTLSVTPSGGPA